MSAVSAERLEMLTDFRSPFPVQPRPDMKPTVVNQHQLINQALGGKRVAGLHVHAEVEKSFEPRKCVWAGKAGELFLQKSGAIYVSLNFTSCACQCMTLSIILF